MIYLNASTKYQDSYTAQRTPGHMSIDLVVIVQQPECCLHSKKNPLPICFLITCIGLHV